MQGARGCLQGRVKGRLREQRMELTLLAVYDRCEASGAPRGMGRLNLPHTCTFVAAHAPACQSATTLQEANQRSHFVASSAHFPGLQGGLRRQQHLARLLEHQEG